MVVNKRAITKCVVVEDGELVECLAGKNVYENVDTSSAVPFGNMNIVATGKLNLESGSGGFSMHSAGETSVTSTSRTTIGGAVVSIGSGDNNAAGYTEILADSDIYFCSGGTMGQVAKSRIDNTTETHTFNVPKALYTGDLEVFGDLIVHGNVEVYGSIGIKVPNGDVCASGISLVKHIHTGDDGGNTSPPKK